MQFEEFDKKVREAAENHHPAYDEKAWAGMEKLLNKHLPQENDDRRRFIFFLFLFLLLGAGSVWLFSSKPWRGNKHLTEVNKTIQKPAGDISAPVSANEEDKADANNKLNKEAISDVSVPENDKTLTGTKAPDKIASIPNTVNKKDKQYKVSATTRFINEKQTNNNPLAGFGNKSSPVDKNMKMDRLNDGKIDVSTTTSATTNTLNSDQKNISIASTPVNDLTTTNTKPVINNPPVKENSNNDSTSLVQSIRGKNEKNKSKKRNTFFFTLSAGPDVSFTGNDKLGKTRLLAGAGLGYTFKDRLTIRSGFYTARKVYTSSPGSYHPPASFWSYYPYLEKVDADCKVYEIPLSLSYNFGHSSKQSWFVSTGISSYLMKKETYNYYYKYTVGGPAYQKKWTIQDENKHYFSVLTLSGGYQKNIGKSFSITVEPYFKIPLSGVGFGKVKLNSGGVLFSVVIKPFAGSGNQKNIHR